MCRQYLQAALGMGCRIRPHASPKACPAGTGAGGGNSSRCEGTQRAELPAEMHIQALCTAESPSTLRATQLEKCVQLCLPNIIVFQWVLKTAKNNYRLLMEGSWRVFCGAAPAAVP